MVCYVSAFTLAYRTQDNTLNALAGVVSLCPAVTGDLFKVEGGNARLSQVRTVPLFFFFRVSL